MDKKILNISKLLSEDVNYNNGFANDGCEQCGGSSVCENPGCLNYKSGYVKEQDEQYKNDCKVLIKNGWSSDDISSIEPGRVKQIADAVRRTNKYHKTGVI